MDVDFDDSSFSDQISENEAASLQPTEDEEIFETEYLEEEFIDNPIEIAKEVPKVAQETCSSKRLVMIEPPKKLHKLQKVFVTSPKTARKMQDLKIKTNKNLVPYVAENLELNKEISRMRLCRDSIVFDSPRCLLYTGLSTEILQMIFHKIEQDLPNNKTKRFQRWEIFIITLYKLRMDHTFEFIADQFDLNQEYMTKYFFVCIKMLYKRFRNTITWPDRSSNIRGKPEMIKNVFEKNFVMIVDCFEMSVEIEDNPIYSRMQTKKYLIAVSTTGHISFISDGFPTTITNLDLLLQTGLLDRLMENDVMLGSKKFFEDNNSNSLEIGCFQKVGRSEIAPIQIEQLKLRVAVEMLVQRIIKSVKRKYEILNKKEILVLPKGCGEIFVDQTVKVCCALYNLGNSQSA